MIKVENLHRRFGPLEDPARVEVLRGVTLTVETGSSVAVTGPSGSGKSTLLNLLGGLDQPSSGSVTVEGQDLTGMSLEALARFRNRDVGFVFQAHHLLPQCTVLENVLLPTLAGHGGDTGTEARGRAEDLLERVGLTERMHHVPGQLSGGERQRAAVVRGLIMNPRLLLADEPTGSLDGDSARTLAALLTELNREMGVTLVLATHAMDLASKLDRVVILRDGLLEDA